MDDNGASGPETVGEDIRKEGFREALLHTAEKAARQIPFIEDVVAAYFCAIDPTTPFKVKAVMASALAYFILPVDLVPDIVAGFGYTDDLAVMAAALAVIRPYITESHKEAAGKALEEGEQA